MRIAAYKPGPNDFRSNGHSPVGGDNASGANGGNGASESRSVASTPAAPAPREQTQNKWLVSIAVIFGVLMSAIDTSVVNVALPNIQGNVGATQQEITWISTGYMISVVILMPLTNWLSTRFGRKRVYLTSLVVFTFSSVMCGLSHTLGDLILWRVIQGMGAGTLQPLAQAMFREAFPPEEQGIAMGVFGFVVLSGPAIGPTLGGYITDNYNWPWIFFINVPIGIIGYFVAQAILVDPPWQHGTKRAKVNGVGIFLLAIGLATLQTVLEQGQTDDWFSSAFITSFSVIAAIALVAFIAWEMHTPEPAVDLRIMKNAQFTAGSIVGGVLGMGLFASLFLLPQYMQTLLGFTATQSGLALMPRSLAMMLMMPVSGMLYNKLGPSPMIIIGLIITTYTQWVMGHFTLDTGAGDILFPQIVQGIGFALIFVALSTAALSTIERTKLTSASGLYNLIRQLGGSFGTAIVVSLLTNHIDIARNNLVSNTNLGNPAFVQRYNGFTGAFMQAGNSLATAKQMALVAINGIVERQSAMIAYDYIFLWIGVLFMICLPLGLFLRGRPKSAKNATAPSEHVAVAE